MNGFHYCDEKIMKFNNSLMKSRLILMMYIVM